MIAGAQILLSNVAVASLLGVAAWSVGRSGRRATLAHALWVAFFVKLITPPLILVPIAVPHGWLQSAENRPTVLSLENPATAASGPTLSVSGAAVEFGGVGTSADVSASASLLAKIDLWRTLVGLWIVGSVVILVRGIIRYLRFRRLLSRAGEWDPVATSYVEELLHRQRVAAQIPATVPRVPRVLRLPVRISPMLVGVGRGAAILCPDQLWKSLSLEERHALLAHETAHYCRRDHWVRWLEWAVTAIYWWFPGVYIARRELERHEEAACDGWAVRQLGCKPRQYAEALLRVVDFLSEHRVGIPRLASGMQPTDSLEQRLRLLIQSDGLIATSAAGRWVAGVGCLALCLIHPWLQPTSSARSVLPEYRVGFAPIPGVMADRSSGVSESTAHPLLELDLPEVPRGFWNESPQQRWASVSLSLKGARLIGEASRGVTIERPQREPLRFSYEDLSAIVEVPSTQRVVIGDTMGRLRLWDLDAGLPTSLIGRHGDRVTSVTYHQSAGIVSADAAGSVMRWDLQSGQVLATWSEAAGPVQSVRYAHDGQSIAVLVGRWSQTDEAQKVHFIDSSSLATKKSIVVPSSTAVVLETEESGWLLIDWSGAVRPLQGGTPISRIAKRDVSGLVLSQDAELDSAVSTVADDDHEIDAAQTLETEFTDP